MPASRPTTSCCSSPRQTPSPTSRGCCRATCTTTTARASDVVAREGLTLHTAAERPDLWERFIVSESVRLEYNLHGDVVNQFWGRLDEELADFQFVLYDEGEDVIVAEGHTGPFAWDGDDATLP